jgi:hypothetical protein
MTYVGNDGDGNSLYQIDLAEHPVILIANPLRKLFICEDIDELGTSDNNDLPEGDG